MSKSRLSVDYRFSIRGRYPQDAPMRRVRDDAEDQPTARTLTNGHVNDGADDAGVLSDAFSERWYYGRGLLAD